MLLTRILYNLIITSNLLFTGFGSTQGSQTPTDICKFARDPKKYESQLVTIRGVVELEAPDKDELYLREVTSDSCYAASRKRIRVGIEYPDSNFLDTAPVDFRIDADSFELTAVKLKEAMTHGRKIRRLKATVRGVAYFGSETQQQPTGKRAHHTPYRVFIVIESISDVILLND